MRILLDTSAYSIFLKGHSGIKEYLQEAAEIYFCPVVIGELLAGFMKGKYKRKNRTELNSFLSSTRVHVLTMDEGTSERYAVILNSLWSVGTSIPTNDIWIASCAMQHGLHVATTDSHYQKVSQVIVDFFE
jgi:predicted nucleic acid-binding protein